MKKNNRLKWEYTTDCRIATLTNPNGRVASATIIYKEDSANYYLHISRTNGKEINDYYNSMATAQAMVRMIY